METSVLPIFLFVGCVAALAVVLLIMGSMFNPYRASRVKRMPYESGMDPIHDTRRRFDVRYHLVAIAFLVFDVELLFLYPWAVILPSPEVDVAARNGAAVAAPVATDAGAVAARGVAQQSAAGEAAAAEARPPLVFAGGMLFLLLLALGFVYDWRKGVFQWR